MDLRVQQVLLENEGLGVNPVSSPRRGLSGGPTHLPTAELLTFQTRFTHSSRDRCWNPCLLTASAQELGAQTAVKPLTRGTAGSLRVARGLGPQHGAAVFSVPAPKVKGNSQASHVPLPFRC